MSAYFSAYSRRKTRAGIYITGNANRMYDQEARKDDKPLILPIEVWCLDWTRSFPYPFHIITAGTIFLPGNCDSLPAKGWQGGMTAKSVRKSVGEFPHPYDRINLICFLLYLPPTSRSPSLPLPPKTDTVAHVLLHRFSNNTLLSVRETCAWELGVN